MAQKILCEQFSEIIWGKIFVEYKKVNRCHWKLPVFTQVKESLAQINKYEFAEGKSSKLVLELQDGWILISFAPTLAHPTPLLQKHIDQMQKAFELELGKICRSN